MSLIARLAEKSWETPGAAGWTDPADYRPPAVRVGLYAFMGVATVIFTLLSLAYVMRMGIPGMMGHGIGNDWRPMPKPPLLWINTGMLAASSLCWERASRQSRRGQWVRDAWVPGRAAALLGSGLGCLFLAGQLLLWQQYHAAGYFLAANPANSFFYLLTAVHGLHLGGGLAAAFRTLRPIADARDVPAVQLNIQLCAIYWHFLLVVWIALAGLLLST